MKRLALITIAIALATLMAGCPWGGRANDAGGFTFTVGDKQFRATPSQFEKQDALLHIQGIAGDDPAIHLYVQIPATTPTTKSLGSRQQTGSVARYKIHEKIYRPRRDGTGTCTIQKLTDSRCQGTFSFTAWNKAGRKVEVTDGSFDVARSATDSP